MSKFETIEVPIHMLDDGREFVTDVDYVQHEYVRAFIGRFPNYWQRSELMQGWVGSAE